MIAQKFGVFITEIHPIDIQLETIRGCNFMCIMCDAWKFKKVSLSFENAKKILTEFEKSIFLTPYGIGEPFLNRDIYNIVKYASEKLKFIVGITSNFSVINPEKALNMGANEIMASIDSVDPQKFFMLRHANLDLVVNNLKNLLSLKRNRKVKYPIISIRTLVSNENINELEDIVKFGLSLGIRKFYFQDSANGYLIKKINNLSQEDVDKIYRLREKFNKKADIIIYLWDSKDKGSIPTGYCFNAFLIGTIGYDGEIYTCCRNFGNNEASLGNILKDPQKALKNRLLFLKKFRKDPPDFCKSCETYCRLCKNGNNKKNN